MGARRVVVVGLVLCLSSAAAAQTDRSSSGDSADLGLILKEAPVGGRVITVRLEVDENGRLSACHVVKSTGSPELDARACKKVRRSVSFMPAIRGGKAVRETTVRRVLLHPPYKTPKPSRGVEAGGLASSVPPITSEDYPLRSVMLGKQGTTDVAYDVTEQGAVENCRVVATSGFGDLDAAACDAITRRGKFTPATDAAGKPVRASSTTRVHWRL